MQMGKYQLLRKLAVGGMAEVFLAKAAGPGGFEKILVVKRILPHLAEDPQFAEMFLSEARLAAQLNHSNIAQIFDFGEEEGAYFLAMEYVDGASLRVLLRRSAEQSIPIPFPLCAKSISLACEGLAYAHNIADATTGEPLHLVHRDISPDNILISRNGDVKVVDFGVAKAANQLHHTKTGVVKGKVAYMPPEQMMNKPLDQRVDVYALGVVLFELVTGEKPHQADNEIALIHSILYEPAVAAKDRRPDVPEHLDRIIARAMAKECDERYQSCRELQADLDQFLIHHGTPVGSFQLAEVVTQLVPPLTVSASSASDSSGEKKRPWKTPAKALSTPLPIPDKTKAWHPAPRRTVTTDYRPATPPPPYPGPTTVGTSTMRLRRLGGWTLLAAVLVLGAGGALFLYRARAAAHADAALTEPSAKASEVTPPPKDRVAADAAGATAVKRPQATTRVPIPVSPSATPLSAPAKQERTAGAPMKKAGASVPPKKQSGQSLGEYSTKFE